jgi:CubicO group peptidase (beta-lactamase class C family)
MSTLRRLAWPALVLCCAAAISLPFASAAESPTKAGNLEDRGDLEAFFDGAVNVQLESKHIAGAVVAVVVGDKVVFTKGYGYADVAARRKVDPEKTLFRVGSVSKLFTWTAVMQQVEEGKLDLDADVNTYLKDVQVPAGFPKAVTLKDLLTHTPGFDDYVLGLFGRKAEDVGPLAHVLTKQMPTRVRPPGELSSYSNHGTALAGHAVACVSGLSWEEYVERRILKPLGMNHTLVRQPAEDELPADHSKGYKWADGRFEAKGFEYVPAAPAGCIGMSAGDAAKFMLAHLNDGQLGGARILKPETARRMREPLFRHGPKCPAMCYGFIEQTRHGQRIVGHDGDTILFHTLMALIPERRVGLFVSYNTDTSAGQRGALFESFLRRYFPQADPPRTEPTSGFRERAKRLEGEYGITRYSTATITKLAALMSVWRVSANGDDTITITAGDKPTRYVEVEPLVFRELDGPRTMVFQEDESGRVRHLFSGEFAPIASVRREWYERSELHGGVIAASLVVFLSALVFWPVIAFCLRGLETPTIKRSTFSTSLSWAGWLLSAVSLGWVIAVAVVCSDPTDAIAFGASPELNALLLVPQFIAALAGVTLLACLVAWVRGYWRLSGRLHYTLVALAGAGFTWFLYYWNLLPFGFQGIVS